MIRVAVGGACGRMGAHVIRAVERDAETVVSAALEISGHPNLGEEIAAGVRVVDHPSEALSRADVAIDFSRPEGTLELIGAAVTHKVAAVIGTTGFAPDQRARIDEASRAVPVVLAANFSLGVNVLLGLVAEAARRLRDYDAEVLELHHAAKVDAPSGTALRLAEAIAEARGVDLQSHRTLSREGETGPRPRDSIGLQSLRAGDSVGEHTVILGGPGERVELIHRALSRDNFATGAVRAARWVVGRPPGLYTMQDVLS